MEKLERRPRTAASRRRIRAQAEWKVDTHILRATGPTRAATRSFISSAALLVKVMARTAKGEIFRSRTRWATRWVSTRVLPDPAPAMTRIGPSGWATASRWTGLSPSSRDGFGKGRAASVMWPPSYRRPLTALPATAGLGDDQLEGAVGVGEAGDLHVDEPGGEGRLPHVVLGQFLPGFAPHRPDGPVGLDPVLHPGDGGEVADLVDTPDDDVGRSWAPLGDLAGAGAQGRPEPLVVHAEDGHPGARLHVELVHQRRGVEDPLGPAGRLGPQLEAGPPVREAHLEAAVHRLHRGHGGERDAELEVGRAEDQFVGLEQGLALGHRPVELRPAAGFPAHLALTQR